MPCLAGPPARSRRLVGLRRARAGRARRSFDVFSQAARFAVTAARFGGWPPTLLLALLFTTGMLVTDGLNGWWISRLIQTSERSARVASRIVAAADMWAEGREAWLGAAAVAILVASFVAGQRRAPARVGRIARRSRRRAVASRRQPSARRTPAAGGSDRR